MLPSAPDHGPRSRSNVPASPAAAPLEVIVKHVTVTWNPERATFEARGARPGQPMEMAAPNDDGRTNAIGPAEVLLASIGGCSAWDVVEILHKQRQPVSGVEVRIDGQQLDEPPWAFTRFVLTYVICGRGVDPAAVERAVRLSNEKYCSVIATVRGVADVESVIELIEESGPEAGCEPAGAAQRGA